MGVVLSQVYNDRLERPVAYPSNISSERERKWYSTRKEAVVTVYAFDKFREYIHGHQITPVTDNWGCHYLKTIEKLSPKLSVIVMKIHKIQFYKPTSIRFTQCQCRCVD